MPTVPLVHCIFGANGTGAHNTIVVNPMISSERKKGSMHTGWEQARHVCGEGNDGINTSGEEIHALHACATQGKAKVRPIPLPPTSGWPPGEVEMSAARTRRSTAREMTAVGCRKWRVKWACL